MEKLAECFGVSSVMQTPFSLSASFRPKVVTEETFDEPCHHLVGGLVQIAPMTRSDIMNIVCEAQDMDMIQPQDCGVP